MIAASGQLEPTDAPPPSDTGDQGAGSRAAVTIMAPGGGSGGGERRRRSSALAGSSASGESDGARRGSAAGRVVRFGETSLSSGRGNAADSSSGHAIPSACGEPGSLFSSATEMTVTSAPRSEQATLELNQCSPVPTAQEVDMRDLVLGELLTMACACCSHAVQEVASVTEQRLLPLGAYQLGVLMPGDTVDVVFEVPLQVQLSDLLAKLRAELEKSHDTGCVGNADRDGLLAAPGLKFKLRGVSVKFLVGQRIPHLPHPSDHSIVQATAGLIAHEGFQELLSRVPSAEQFNLLLRFVRVWAKQRGVYGCFLGFFGGAAWAVCCARVCQLHPYLELPQLATRFFRTLSRWDWRQPVAVLPAGTNILSLDAAQASPVAVSLFSSDGTPTGAGASSGMIVQLPAGAGINATPHVSETTAKIMQKELRRGYKMLQQVEHARAEWRDVYAAARFFQRYRHYLEFDFMASSEEVLAEWLVWAKRQMQNLAGLFDSMSSKIVTLRPWPEWLQFKDADWPCARALFVGLHLERSGETTLEGSRRCFDLREPIVKFLELISAWPEAESHANQFDLLIRHVRLVELEQWLENRSAGVLAHDAMSGYGVTAALGRKDETPEFDFHDSLQDAGPVLEVGDGEGTDDGMPL